MMADIEQLWRRLCAGRRLSANEFDSLMAAPATLARVLQLARTVAESTLWTQRDSALEVLFRVVHRPAGARLLREPQVAALLDQYVTGDAAWGAHTQLALDLMDQAGLPSDHAVRAMLSGPPQTGKVAALERLWRRIGPDDEAMLAGLMRDPREAQAARNLAISALLQLAGSRYADEAGRIMASCAADATAWSVESLPEATRARLVPAFIEALADAAWYRRDSAAATLVVLGRPAVEPLAEVVRRSPSPTARAAAEQALRQLDPARLRRAIEDGQRDDRQLSSAPVVPPVATRGLSPSEGPGPTTANDP